MAGTEATLYEIRKGAAWITLNRPENRNALSAVLVNELFEHLHAVRDRCIRTGVLCRGGPQESAGVLHFGWREGCAVSRRAHRDAGQPEAGDCGRERGRVRRWTGPRRCRGHRGHCRRRALQLLGGPDWRDPGGHQRRVPAETRHPSGKVSAPRHQLLL